MKKRWTIAIAFVGLLIIVTLYYLLRSQSAIQPVMSNRPDSQPLQGEDIITILYTGNTQSYIEPCGCYPGQSGGVARRATLIERIRKQRPSLLLVDAGGNFDGENRLDELRARANMEAMKAMGYDAILFTPEELRFGTDFSTQITTELQLPFISTTSSPLQGSSGVIQPDFIKEAPLHKSLVLGVSSVDDQGLEHLSDTLIHQIGKRKGKDTTVILLSGLEKRDNRRIARQVEEIDVIISMQPKERGIQSERVGQTVVAYCTPHGETLGQIDLKFDEHGEVTDFHVQEHFMDETVPDHEAVRTILNDFYHKVAVDEALQALGKPLFTSERLESDKRNSYVGSTACQTCHQPEFNQWKTTRHAFAFNTLLKAQKHFYPDCVSCHVVGFGYQTGYTVREDQDHFRNVGCETCHGPGGKHIVHPSNQNIRGTVEKKICLECHNQKHSPGFHERIDLAIPKVDHTRTTPDIRDILITEIKGQKKTQMELYVMSLCPFAATVKKQILPLVKRYRSQIDFTLFYIADDLGRPAEGLRGFDSLHGIPEIEENIRQLVIAKYYPDKLLDYLLCHAKHYRTMEGWRQCATRLGIDAANVEKMSQTQEGLSLLRDNIKNQGLSIKDSPTLIVNGTVYKSEQFGLQHCSGDAQRNQDEYAEQIVPITLDPEKAINSETSKLSADQKGYLKEILPTIKKTVAKKSAENRALLYDLELQQQLQQIATNLQDLLDQDSNNPYLSMLLGEIYRLQIAEGKAVEMHSKTGSILNNQWTVIGPWSTQQNFWGLTAFNKVLPPEKQIAFGENYKAVSKSRNRSIEMDVGWVKPDFDIVQSYVDIRSVLRASTMACYAVCYLKLPSSMEAQMRIGVNGAIKVWVNDKLSFVNPDVKRLKIDDHIVPVKFNKGSNKVLIKVVQRGFKATGFLMRLTDQDGNPIRDIETVLPPETSRLPKRYTHSWRVIAN